MFLKIIDLYIGTSGFISLLLVLGVILYTLYQLTIRKKLISLLIFVVFISLFIINETQQILVIGSMGIMIITFSYYFYFVFRCFSLKKPMKKEPADYPHISILIPAKNEAKVIKETLVSVSQADYPTNKFDIIVIDDGSTDNTYQLVSSLKHIKNLKFIHHSTSHGKANSLNEVVDGIKSEYFIVLDADHWIDRDFLKKALSAFDSPNIACVQGTNAVRNGKVSLLSRLIEMEYEERYELIMKGRITPLFMGSAGMFNTRIFKEIGGFHPEILTEDYEISHRIYLKGYRIAFDSTLKSYELATVDLKNFYIQRHRWFRGIWQTLAGCFKELVKSKKVSLPAKMVIFHNYFEGFALVPYLFLSILGALDLLKVVQFNYKYFIYALVMGPTLLHIVTILMNRKFSRLVFLIFIPFYYVFFSIPTFIAMIDNWFVKLEYKWNKTDRSTIKDLESNILLEKEIAAVQYNEKT